MKRKRKHQNLLRYPYISLLFHSISPFVFTIVYGLFHVIITVMSEKSFNINYYFICFMCSSLFLSAPLFSSPSTVLVCDYLTIWKHRPPFLFCGSRTSIVSADVAHNRHGVWQRWAVVFCLCACRLSFCLFPREIICTSGATNTFAQPSYFILHPYHQPFN